MLCRIVFAIVACALLQGCATIVTRGPWLVPVTTEPPGATVYYVDAIVGKTPCTVQMWQTSSRVRLELDGFHPQVADAGLATNGAILGNLLFGGVVGLVVDGASGSGSVINNSPMVVALTPLVKPAPLPWARPISTQAASDAVDGW